MVDAWLLGNFCFEPSKPGKKIWRVVEPQNPGRNYGAASSSELVLVHSKSSNTPTTHDARRTIQIFFHDHQIHHSRQQRQIDLLLHSLYTLYIVECHCRDRVYADDISFCLDVW